MFHSVAASRLFATTAGTSSSRRVFNSSLIRLASRHHPATSRSMGTITDGVEFDTIAREWRCKWSKDNDMKSLQQAQQALDDILADLKQMKGCQSVHRIVCGGELDFKVCEW